MRDHRDRRDFIKRLAASGALLYLYGGGVVAQQDGEGAEAPAEAPAEIPDLDIRWRSVPVRRNFCRAN